MLLQYRSRDWLRSNICAVLRCRHLLDTEISVLDSFSYPEIPRVTKCCVRCPAPNDPSKNSPSNSHFLFQCSMEFPDLGTKISGTVQLDLLSPFRKTPPLQRSMLSSSDALIQISECGYRSEPPIALPRDWVASKVAVHEDCDLVNMFPSSKSQRCFGLSHQIPRCTIQRDKVEFTRLAHSLGQMFRSFSQIQLGLGQV